jgi:ribosomal protein S18 acetylase RimI-like enzyme
MGWSSGNGIVLRFGTVDDAAAAAALHAGQIGEGFLSVLGPKFLRRLYRRVALAPGSFLLVVEHDAAIVGFLAGSSDVAALYRTFAWRDGPIVALLCGGRLLRSWHRVLETLRHGRGHAGDGAELLSVAVDPVIRGRGAGSTLVEGFLDEIRRRGFGHAYVVVAAGNDTAIRLYRQTGFELAERFELHAGTESLLMQWTGRPAART